jgi:hypothetical protein
VVGVGALVVLVPGAPLVPILFISQAINAALLLPLLAFIALLTRDRSLMGRVRNRSGLDGGDRYGDADDRGCDRRSRRRAHRRLDRLRDARRSRATSRDRTERR